MLTVMGSKQRLNFVVSLCYNDNKDYKKKDKKESKNLIAGTVARQNVSLKLENIKLANTDS